MSEKMREEFESWTMQYGFDDGEHMWQAWQASRAALRVELPENCKGMTLTVTEFHKQLDEAGVSYK